MNKNMELYQQLENIKTKPDFIKFVKSLSLDFEKNNDEWENGNIATYLEALSAYVDSHDDAKFDNDLSKWSIMAKILYSGKIYE